MKFEIETITPELAERYLATSRGNRPLKVAKVKSYQRDIEGGKWVLNGEPIIFDSEGSLVDGHHRLTACVRAARDLSTAVVRGAPKSADKTYDMGASRTIGDALSYHGVKNSNHLVAVIGVVASIANKRPRSANLSSSEVFDFIEAYPCIEDAAVVAARKIIPRAGAVVGAISFIAKVNHETRLFEDFLNALATGIPSYPGCPAHVVRERIIRDAAKRNPMSLRDVHMLITAAWEKFRAGASITTIRPQKVFSVAGWPLDD